MNLETLTLTFGAGLFMIGLAGAAAVAHTNKANGIGLAEFTVNRNSNASFVAHFKASFISCLLQVTLASGSLVGNPLE